MAYLHNNKDQFQDAIELAYEQTGVMAQAIEKDYAKVTFDNNRYSSSPKYAMSMSGDTPQEYLLKVLEAEIDYRNTKRKKLHLKQAGFDNLKTFEGYDFDHIVIPNTTSIDGIKTLDFMSRNENLSLCLSFNGRNIPCPC